MIKIYIDAATHPIYEKSGGGMVIINDSKQTPIPIPLAAKDNHSAEFETLCFALKYCVDHYSKEHLIIIYSDSRLVVDTMEKAFVKKEIFKEYLVTALGYLEQLPPVFIEWLPDQKNKGADNIARTVLFNKLQESKNKGEKGLY